MSTANSKKLKKISGFGNRIRYAIDNIDDTQASFAKKLGVGTAQLNKWITETYTPSAEVIAEIANLAGVSADWLLTGQGPKTRGAGAGANEGEFVSVPLVRGEISAGGGLVPDDSIEMRVAFRRDWITRKGNPRNMSLIRVQGDSMAPTLQSGDIVLVDHNRDYADPAGGIYAVAVDHHIMIKRVQYITKTGSIRIISDNSAYQPEEYPAADIAINGKVIWYGRELER